MAGLVTRLFTPADGVNIWELLNEVKGWIDTLRDQGTSARYWTGQLVAKSTGDGKNVSVRMSGQIDQAGGLTPAWDADTFKLPAGRYRISVLIRFNANSGGYRTLSLMKNPGVTTYNSSNSQPGTYVRSVQVANSANDTSVMADKILTVADSDVFMIVVRQTSGGTVDLLTNPWDSELSIQRIGD